PHDGQRGRSATNTIEVMAKSMWCIARSGNPQREDTVNQLNWQSASGFPMSASGERLSKMPDFSQWPAKLRHHAQSHDEIIAVALG
ncbi:MAG: hypothetical protein WB505_06455, partial [Pseudolabrys sp.]